MSVDNTVAVLKTLSNSRPGYEYRVAHVQAIENSESDDRAYLRRWMVACFGRSPVFCEDTPYGESAEEQAWKAALSIAGRLRRECILEYGVRSVFIEEPFPAEAQDGVQTTR